MLNSIDEYEQKVVICNKCELAKTRCKVVPGNGNINAKIMMIGQAPGDNEDRSGKEFVGKSGQMLDLALDLANINKEDIYFTSVVKCHVPYNKEPKPDQIMVCINYLRFQVMTIKPKLIVLLGKVAFNTVFGFKEKFTPNRGKILEKNNNFYLVTYHPSAVLRDENKRGAFLTDLKKINLHLEERAEQRR